MKNKTLTTLFIAPLVIALSFTACKKTEETQPETTTTTAATTNTNSNTPSTNTPNTNTPETITGTVSTFAGSLKTKGIVDGVGTAATFQIPYGIFSDDNNLYITQAGKFNFVSKKSPYVIRKINISTQQVTTLTTITENLSDNVNNDKAYASSMVIIGDSIYLGIGHKFFKINKADGAMTSTAFASASESYGKLFLKNSKLYSVDDSGVYEVDKVSGVKTLQFKMGVEASAYQSATIIGDKIYVGIDNNLGDVNNQYRYTMSFYDFNTQDSIYVNGIETSSFAYGFEMLTNNGSDVFFLSNGRNGMSYHFGKVNASTKAVTKLSEKDKGFADGSLADAVFDGPRGITYTNGNFYIVENGNLLVRKITLD